MTDPIGQAKDMRCAPLAPGSTPQPQHSGCGHLNRFLTSRPLDLVLATRRGVAVTIPDRELGQYAERIAREIAAEHTLVAARMNWNLSFQGFLFAAFAFAVSRQTATKPDARLELLLDALPVAGSITAALTLFGVLAAFTQINGLKRAWFANEAELRAVAPRPFSHWLGGLIGRLPPVGITGVLIWCWFQLK